MNSETSEAGRGPDRLKERTRNPEHRRYGSTALALGPSVGIWGKDMVRLRRTETEIENTVRTLKLNTDSVMAATIALSARPFLPNLATFFPQISAWTPFRWTASPLDSLLELFPPFLLAVPKKKTSHSRKAMRSANKGLKDKRSAYSLSNFHRNCLIFCGRYRALLSMRITKTRTQSLSKLLLDSESRVEGSG